MIKNTDQANMSTSIKKILPNLLLAFVAMLFTLLILEIGVRWRVHLENQNTLAEVFKTGTSEVVLPASGQVSLAHIIRLSRNPQIIYELKPNISVNYLDSLTTLNEQGFRSKNYPAQDSGDALRIVGVGDSFMFGQGVSDGEQYLAALEDQLNQAFSDRPWEIINMAVPGYNTVMEVETLKEKGIKYNPDIVIIEFVGNDISLPNFIREQVSPFTSQKSFLLEFISERMGYIQQVDEIQNPTLRRLRDFGLVVAPRDIDENRIFEDDPSKVPSQYWDMVGWDAYVRAMNELKDLQKEYGFEVISISLAPDESTLKYQALELSEEIGFHVIDVGASLRRYMEQNGIESYLGSPLAVSEDNGHPSALGHRIAAERLFEYLTQENLIDGSAFSR